MDKKNICHYVSNRNYCRGCFPARTQSGWRTPTFIQPSRSMSLYHEALHQNIAVAHLIVKNHGNNFFVSLRNHISVIRHLLLTPLYNIQLFFLCHHQIQFQAASLRHLLLSLYQDIFLKDHLRVILF